MAFLQNLPFGMIRTLFLVLLSFSLRAAVTPNRLFSDHMVLQRGVDVPVWGTASAGESIQISIAGQTVPTTATNGTWMIRLKPLPVGGPYQMTITGTNTVVISDILVGDVWIASGQSNMERQLGPRGGQKLLDNWEQERDAAHFPTIRQYALPRNYAPAPVSDTHQAWVVCSPQTVSNFTAVGYFFAKDLVNTYHVPIGIILTAYGGSPAQSWMSRAALEQNPELRFLVDQYDRSLKQLPNAVHSLAQKIELQHKQYRADSLLALQQQKPLPTRPEQPYNVHQDEYLSGLYHGMLNPLIPFAIKGVIWYQGENNVSNPTLYQKIMPAMIANWRADWQQGNFPFLFVQVAPYQKLTPELREAQLLSWQQTKHTAMVVTTDCGDANDIHPTNKKPVGERLSLAAKVLAYGEHQEYSGPVYRSMRIKGDRIILRFTHTGTGLVSKDGPLKGFTIAGSDANFVPAEATIKGNTIIVSSDRITKPKAVRYGWANVPDVNLYNQEGLPASPFRTDTER